MKFKIGYYYKYKHKKIPNIWYGRKLYDRKWRKCIKSNEIYIMFENLDDIYHFINYEDFIESKHHPYVKKLLKEINGG
jgi:hypothetical protein